MEQLTVKVPGATGDAKRLLMDWKVAAGTPAIVFTITFPLTVPKEEDVDEARGETLSSISKPSAPSSPVGMLVPVTDVLMVPAY